MIATILALGMPGFPELLTIGLIVLVLFGSKKLPELARGLGQSFQEFRKAKDEFTREITSDGEKDNAGDDGGEPLVVTSSPT